MGTMFFGAYLAMRYPPEQLLRLLAWTVAITSVFSLVFGIALPKYGVHAEPSLLGAWRGVFDDKLRLGLISTLGILVFLLLALEIKSYRWLAWACLVLCGVLLALSGSRISWLITGALLVILIWLWTLLKTHYSIAIPMMFIWTLIFLGGVAWISANIEIATALIGRDSTLTGRTFLWNIFTEDMDRPYFGFGYRSYLYSQAFSMVQFRHGIALSGAHNGYLTLWLELGFVGIAVFLLTIWVGLRRLLAYFPRPRATFQVWLPVLFLYCLISTVPAPVILAQNHLIWVLFVASLFYWPRVARSG